MRHLRWESQERVDVPDFQQLSFLVDGEFRRINRALIVGAERAGIIQGFKVEPQASPNGTVRVRLDIAGVRGAAILPTATDGEINGTVAQGQLAGSVGDEEVLEGNATYTIDFSSQPSNTYFLECNFVYVPGSEDNRAKWDPANSTEFIDAMYTRYLPTVQFRVGTSQAGTGWCTLASVVWGGSTITAGNITDLRPMLFEGATPFYRTSFSGVGGMADFDRSDARPDVTTDGVYTVLQKLGRQIQDLKGPNEQGRFSFYSRNIRPMDPSSNLSSQQVRSFGTLDMLEFTVGDGISTFGDFSGAGALQACLSHIAFSEASLPFRIRIRLKSRVTGTADTSTTASPVWTVSAGFLFATAKHIQIVGETSYADQRGRVPVAFTYNGGPVFQMASGSTLELENITTHGALTQPLIRTTARFRAYNCLIAATSATKGIIAQVEGTAFEDCELACNIVVWSPAMCSFQRTHFLRGTFFGQACESHLRGWVDTANLTADTPANSNQWLTRATFESCRWLTDAAPAANATWPAIADLRGGRVITFARNQFEVPVDSDQLLFGTVTQDGRGSRSIVLDDCVFNHSTPSGSTHDVSAGYNGSQGTGWGVFAYADISASITSAKLAESFNTNFTIRNCRWLSHARIDAGGCRFITGRNIVIDNCCFENIAFTNPMAYTGNRRFRAVFMGGTSFEAGNPGVGSDLTVRDCSFGRLGLSGAVPEMHYVYVAGHLRRLSVRGCSFHHADTNGASLAPTNGSYAAAGTNAWVAGIFIDACRGLMDIEGNDFFGFTETGLLFGCVVAIRSQGHGSGAALRAIISRNTFRESGPAIYSNDEVAWFTINDNQWDIQYGDAVGGFGFGALLFGQQLSGVSRLMVTNNLCHGSTSGFFWALYSYDANYITFVGNDCTIQGLTGANTPPNVHTGWSDDTLNIMAP